MSGPYRDAPMRKPEADDLTLYFVALVWKGDTKSHSRHRWILARDGAGARDIALNDLGVLENAVWTSYVISRADFDFVRPQIIEGEPKKEAG